MRKTTLAIAAAAALMLALAGCSSAPAATPAAKTAPTTVPSASPTAAPITVTSTPTPTPKANARYGTYTQDEFYLKAVAGWYGTRPSDEQLIAAAHQVCDKFRAGGTEDSIRVVKGTGHDADWDNHEVVVQAAYVYCPEFSKFGR